MQNGKLPAGKFGVLKGKIKKFVTKPSYTRGKSALLEEKFTQLADKEIT